MEKQRTKLESFKYACFSLVATIHNNAFTNSFLLIALSLSEILSLHYYYINPNYSFLHNFQHFSWYFKNVFPEYVLIATRNQLTTNIIFLTAFPCLLIILLILNCLRNNYYLILLAQIILALIPLFNIRITLEIISLHQLIDSPWIYVAPVLVILSLAMLMSAFTLYDKKLKLLQFPLIIMIQLKVNHFAIFGFLVLRLLLLFYFGYKYRRTQRVLKCLAQTALLIVLLVCLFAQDLLLNYIAFITLLVSFVAVPIYKLYDHELDRKKILNAAVIADIDVQAQNKLYQYLERHCINCEDIECICFSVPDFDDCHKFSKWILKFLIQIMSKSSQFKDQIQVIEMCLQCQGHCFKGLIKLNNLNPKNLLQEYTFYRLTSKYQMLLRSQTSNQHQKRYLLPCQQVNEFQSQIDALINNVKLFWQNLADFDGSTKFIDLITYISKQVSLIKKQYAKNTEKYDQHSQFTYAYDIFKAIILQKKTIEDIKVPQETIYFISQKERIIDINRPMSKFLKTSKDQIINKPYRTFIPHIYRDFHEQWVQQYIQNYQSIKLVPKKKPILIKQGIIQMVQMTSKIMPRCIQGIQIITFVKQLASQQKDILIQKQIKDFHLLIDIQNLRIKYFDKQFLASLGILFTQKNVQAISEMKINDFFPKINSERLKDKNPPRDIFLNSKLNENCELLYNIEFDFNQESYSQSNIKKDKIFDFQISDSCLQKSLSNFRIIKIIPSTYQSFQAFQPESQETKIIPQNSYIKRQQVSQNQNQIQQKNQQRQQEQRFCLPVYFLILPVAFHLICYFYFLKYESAANLIVRKNQFWFGSSSECLRFKGASFVQDRSQSLKKLWMEGFGKFPQMFCAIEHSTQDEFIAYNNQMLCVKNHNLLSYDIEQQMKQYSSQYQTFQLLLICCVVISLVFSIIDFIASVNYMRRVENKVQDIILIFLRLSDNQISQTLNDIKKQQGKFFGKFQRRLQQFDQSMQDMGFLTFQTPTYIRDQSFNFQPIDSINKRLYQKAQHQPSILDGLPEDSSGTLRGLKTRRMSSFQRMAKQQSIKQIQEIGLEKVIKFQQKKSIISVLKRSIASWLIVVIGNTLLLVMTFMMLFIVLYLLPQLHLNVKVSRIIQQTPIILLKQIQEKVLNVSLEPSFTINVWNANLKSQIQLLNYHMDSLKSHYQFIQNKDNCDYLQQSKNYKSCQTVANGVLKLGQMIALQYIGEKIRRTTDNLLTDLQFCNLIRTQLEILQLNKEHAKTSMNYYKQMVSEIELIIVICCMVIIAISLIMIQVGLSFYRKRIIQTENLLSIIPTWIVDKRQDTIMLENQMSIYPIDKCMSIKV